MKKYLVQLFVKIRYSLFKYLPEKTYSILIKINGRICLRENINLDNPKTFNEKIQWLKLYDKNPLKTQLADKYNVREWVKEKIGEEYLIPIIGVWKNFDDIDFQKLPSKFVLKTTHGCGTNIIVKDKKTFAIKDARRKINKWMKLNYAYFSGELHYKNIHPMIIAEEYLENKCGELNDYKVFCFNGKAKYIMYLCDRNNGLKMAFYDTDWNKQEFTYSYPLMEKNIPKPDHLDELIEVSEKLSEEFEVVRVDFYVLDDGSLKFGEMTFTSAGGFCKWNPELYNITLGDMVDISKR